MKNREFILIEEKNKGDFQKLVNNVLENYTLTSAGCTFREGKYIAFLFVKKQEAEDLA